MVETDSVFGEFRSFGVLPEVVLRLGSEQNCEISTVHIQCSPSDLYLKEHVDRSYRLIYV